MTNLNDPRIAVTALLHGVRSLMADMQAQADALQHWLNATAADRAEVPAPVLVGPAPVPAAAPAPARRGRKPKEKHPVLEALLRMAKGWTGRADVQDLVVIVEPWGIRTLPNAKIYWDYRCETSLTRGRAAVSGRELLDVMKRAGANATLTASDDGLSLQVEGDVVVRLRAQGAYTPELWDEQDKFLPTFPPTTVAAQGEWSAALLAEVALAARIASKDTTRGNINTVLLDPAGCAVATDGHRLEARPIEYTGAATLVPSYLAPVLASCTSAVTWQANPARLRISEAEGVSFTVALCRDSFPAWKHVMPSRNNAAMVFAIRVERELLHLRSKTKPATISHWYCQLTGPELQVEERGNGGDETAKFSLPVQVLARPGDDCLPRFGLDYTYVRDMCEGSDSKYITLFVLDQYAPILCSSADTYEDALDMAGGAPVHIIMPVRI